MFDFAPFPNTFVVSPKKKPKVALTPGWFADSTGKTNPPRPGNVMQPLINGERTFAAIHEAINNAKKSVDILTWGFDPAVRMLRPNGERLGDLLRRKSDDQYSKHCNQIVNIRVLVWKPPGGMGQETTPGDGLFGSGGLTVFGSGMGSASKPTSTNQQASYSEKEDFNTYLSGSGSGAIKYHDEDAQMYNRDWFAHTGAGIDYHTIGFSFYDRADRMLTHKIMGRDRMHNFGMSAGPSHHQKIVLVDYESPEDAVGFIMGHNLMRDYWDTDAHEYSSPLRHGFGPFHDLSCRIYGPALYDINATFANAWEREIGSGKQKYPDTNKRRQKITPEEFIAPAKQHGKTYMAQVCRTNLQDADFSIKNIYEKAVSNARNYLYFENQYFRYPELIEVLIAARRQLKAAGHTRELYIFVVTMTPGGEGKKRTYEMLNAMGQGKLMPGYHKKENNNEINEEEHLRKGDLEGLNIHVCCIEASKVTSKGAKYKKIYVHSKLLLADDVFFTVGSANLSVRSMENDTEINIASPAPEITKAWRRHLWKSHTGASPSANMAYEFKRWGELMTQNKDNKTNEKRLKAPLMEFFDGETGLFNLD